jgi:CheY-like chemotaxis protein
MLRFTVASELRDAGYTVMTVARGEEALAILRGPTLVDALLTDIRLPGRLDGWDIAEQARAVRPDLPVIYATAYSYATPRQVPGSIMLDKPYKPQVLLDALANVLD